MSEPDGMSHTVLAIRWETNRGKQSKKILEFYTYDGLFSLVLLVLVDTEFRFLSVDVVTSGFASVAQIFKCCKLKKKIENGTLVLQPQKPLLEGGPTFELFLTG